MNSPEILLLFLVIAFSSLLAVNMINCQEINQHHIRRKLRALKRRISDLEVIAASLEALMDNADCVQVVWAEIIDILKDIRQLSPNDAYINITDTKVRQRIEQLSDPKEKVELFRLMENATALAKAQYEIQEAARIVRKRHAKGQLETPLMALLIEQLAWANTMVSVISHIAYGHKALRRGNITGAYSNYKKAHSVVTHYKGSDSRKPLYVAEISEILSNRRKALSLKLMPETLHNPGENCKFDLSAIPRNPDLDREKDNDSVSRSSA